MKFLPVQSSRTGFAVLVVTSLVAGAAVGSAAEAETAGLGAGESLVAAKFRDRCDGGSDVQLPNPYATDLAFEVNGERVVVPPQQRPWHAVAVVGRNRVVELRIFSPAAGGQADELTHVWTPASSCAGSGEAKLRGSSRLSVEDNGLAGGDSIVAARFRDGCGGASDVQLPNPSTADLVFDVNGDRVVVGPQQQPWHATTAAGRRRTKFVDVIIERPGGAGDSITHVWKAPATCADTAVRQG